MKFECNYLHAAVADRLRNAGVWLSFMGTGIAFPLLPSDDARRRTTSRSALKLFLALLLCAGSLAAGEQRDDISVETPAGETVKLMFLADGIVRVTAWPKRGREPGPGDVVTVKGESPLT